MASDTDKKRRKGRDRKDEPVSGQSEAGRDSGIGSKRGIETMLRSAYRINTEMKALADNKANMLISVNGLILSIMIATGGLSFMFTQSRAYLLPVILLAVTSLVAMVLAILVARPRGDFSWHPGREDFDADRANPFHFLHFSGLNEQEYLQVIEGVIQDRRRLYRHMIAHNYLIGVILDRKFRLLRWSYGAFIAGLVVTVGVFVATFAASSAERAATDGISWRELPDIYEPSALAALPDGRILTVEDEKELPYSLLRFNGDGKPDRQSVRQADQPEQLPKLLGPVDDLEGLAADRIGNVYMITSHSRRKKNGERPPGRASLLRLRLDGNQVAQAERSPPLLPVMTALWPEIGRAEAVIDVKKDNGLNIEGLSLNPKQDKLLIGFRSPVSEPGAQALVAVLEDIDQLFTTGAKPRFAPELIRLDLDGGGIRGMSWVPRLKAYLLISGHAGGGDRPFRLWSWSGDPAQSPRPFTVRGLTMMRHPEGIATVNIAGVERLLLVSDDGDQSARRSGHYLIFDYKDMVF